MNTTNDRNSEEERAKDRLAEVIEVYQSAARAVHGLIQRIEEGDEDAAKKTVTQLLVLQDLFARIRKSEEAFHERFGQDTGSGGVDLVAARDEIQRRLDRLCSARNQDGISGQSRSG